MSARSKGSSVQALVYAKYVSTKVGDITGYEELSFQRFARTYAHYLRGWLPRDKDAKILEAGCGHGNMLFALKSWGYTNVQGIDCSEEQVHLARRRFPNVELGDVLDGLPGKKDEYDMILGIDFLEHLSLDEAVHFLEASRSALCESGRLVLQIPNAGCVRGGEVAWGDVTHCRAYAVSAIAQLLRLCGFVAVEFRETGPVILGFSSLLRWVLWHISRTCLAMYDLAEVGRIKSIYTRTMLASGVKRWP
jgi:2-polyprenyl-3-methyl-5-hydroxy-6-metoxy-1,4-benzoquinol methylase